MSVPSAPPLAELLAWPVAPPWLQVLLALRFAGLSPAPPPPAPRSAP